MKYIQTITAGIQFAAEYDSSSGPVLLRLGQALTPGQAAEHQKALNEINGG